MNGRGIGSAYLWALKKGEEYARKLTEDIRAEHLKELAQYEVDVCRYCRQSPCEFDDLAFCYKKFEARGG